MEAVTCNPVVLLSVVKLTCPFRAEHCGVPDQQVSPKVIPDTDCLSYYFRVWKSVATHNPN